MLAAMLSNIPHEFRYPLLGGGWGRLHSTLKRPTLFALPSLWEGLGVGFRGQGKAPLTAHTPHLPLQKWGRGFAQWS